MGVYIKDMEMPTSCLKCDWCAHTIPADNYICYRLNRAVIGVAEEDVNETVNACCPLVPVPPHGNLIDRDALVKSDRMVGKLMMYGGECVYTQAEIDRAPTIIPASEELT